MRRKIIAIVAAVVILAGCVSVGVAVKHKNSKEDPGISTSQSGEQSSDKNKPDKKTTESQTEATEAPTVPSSPSGADGKDKVVAITFDDGPGKYTADLINELNKRNVKATFFMLGQNVGRYPDAVRLMAETGHQLGSHTYSHVNIRDLTNDEFLQQINDTDDALNAACGQKATAFRPPYGKWKTEKLDLIDKTVALWSVDTQDWKTKNPESIKNEMLANTKDGSIILLHDIYQTSVEGALAGIDELIAQGYSFVTVDELLGRDGMTFEKHKPYSSCPRTAG